MGWEASAVDASPNDASYIFMLCKPAHHLQQLVRQPGAERCHCLFPPVAFIKVAQLAGCSTRARRTPACAASSMALVLLIFVMRLG